jgi:glycosyltransferase involved in cell wall biosynthesis
LSAADRAGASPRLALLFATSGHSGVDRLVQNLVPELLEIGVAIDLLQVRGHGPALPAGLPGLRVVPLGVAHKVLTLLPLIRYLRSEPPAALLSANHPLNRNAVLARLLGRVGVPVTVRMGMAVSSKAGELGGAGDRLVRSMRRWYPCAYRIVCPSRGVARDLLGITGLPEDAVRVLPSPVVGSDLHRLAAEDPGHHWLADRSVPTVLGVGELSPRKDFETLVRAFALVRAERRCRLILLGEGERRRALGELAESLGVGREVDLPGFVANPYAYMARAAVFVLASRREGFGAVLAEALATGTPVVSTDCPSGPAEILEGGRYGPLVPVGDPPAMARAIAAVLDDPLPAAVLRQAAAPYGVRESARRYLEAVGLGALAGPPPGSPS